MRATTTLRANATMRVNTLRVKTTMTLRAKLKVRMRAIMRAIANLRAKCKHVEPRYTDEGVSEYSCPHPFRSFALWRRELLAERNGLAMVL